MDIYLLVIGGTKKRFSSINRSIHKDKPSLISKKSFESFPFKKNFKKGGVKSLKSLDAINLSNFYV